MTGLSLGLGTKLNYIAIHFTTNRVGSAECPLIAKSGHFNIAGAYSLLPDDLARDQPVGTAPFGTRSKEILMRCISELKGMVR